MRVMSPVEAELRNILRDPQRLRREEPLARHTTFRIGGPAEYFVEVAARAELAAVLRFVQATQVPFHILGNGSNLLVGDAGVRGVVLMLAGDLAKREISGHTVTAGGGYNLPRLAMEVSRMGLGGLAFACAIPGTVGAGLLINAGAHGGEMKDVVTAASIMWRDGREQRLSPAEIGFRYRGSDLQGTDAIVLDVVFELHPADPARLDADIRHLLERRRHTQPLQFPNAGSIFKNPPGDFAGRLIEQAGCKGWREGDAEVSPKHANFVVNLGRATAQDVISLALRVQERVQVLYGVRLEPEVRIWGPNPLA